jgi:hypothetical protein
MISLVALMAAAVAVAVSVNLLKRWSTGHVLPGIPGYVTGCEDPTPVGTVSTTSLDDVFGLTAGTNHYYVVTSLNQAREGVPSSEVSTIATPGTPGPSQLTAATLSGPAFRLDWTLPDGGSPITKYVMGDAVRLVTLTATPTGPLTYTDTTVTSGTTYSYQVRAVNASGSGQLSNKASSRFPDSGAAGQPLGMLSPPWAW